MALSRSQKEAQVAELKEKISASSSVIFAHYIGLTVSQITRLRRELKKQQAEMQVAKKSLIQIAAKLASAPSISDDLLPGPVACIFSMNEPTAGANVAFTFAKDHPQVKLIGGMFSGRLLSKTEVNDMAVIPSRQGVLAMFLSMCQSPLVSFTSACSGPLTGFTRALGEVAKKKEVQSPTSIAVIREAPAASPPAG